eukprot:28099_1
MPTSIETYEEWEKALEDAAKNKKIIIAKFGTAWCGPCKLIADNYHELEKKYCDMIFLEIDCDDNEDVAEYYEISSLPTFIVFKEGKEIETERGKKDVRMMGACKNTLAALVSKYYPDAVQGSFSMNEDF